MLIVLFLHLFLLHLIPFLPLSKVLNADVDGLGLGSLEAGVIFHLLIYIKTAKDEHTYIS